MVVAAETTTTTTTIMDNNDQTMVTDKKDSALNQTTSPPAEALAVQDVDGGGESAAAAAAAAENCAKRGRSRSRNSPHRSQSSSKGGARSRSRGRILESVGKKNAVSESAVNALLSSSGKITDPKKKEDDDEEDETRRNETRRTRSPSPFKRRSRGRIVESVGKKRSNPESAVSSLSENNNNSNDPNEETSNSSSIQPKSKTPFRLFRGMLKGGDRSSRRPRKLVHDNDDNNEGDEKSASDNVPRSAVVSTPRGGGGGGGGGHDEVSTIYDVTVDERSAPGLVATPNTVSSTKSHNSNSSSRRPRPKEPQFFLRMILLLMDISSRRFELLQLEFDSERALVSDILEQVPESVTVQSLRGQAFDGIISVEGEEKEMREQLVQFCKGNDILVAVPQGFTPRETAKLARQILSNPKIASMLLASGIDVPAWARDSITNRELSFPNNVTDANNKGDEKDLTQGPSRRGGSFLLAAMMVGVVAALLSYLHRFLSMPLEPGHVVSPGVVLSKCGLADFWSGCQSAYLEVQPGRVFYYQGKELEWAIHGPVCPEGQITAKACRNGLEFKPDRTVWLGGEPITWLMERLSDDDDGGGEKLKNMTHFVPWPFSVEPNIKTWEVPAERLRSPPVRPPPKTVISKDATATTTTTTAKQKLVEAVQGSSPVVGLEEDAKQKNTTTKIVAAAAAVVPNKKSTVSPVCRKSEDGSCHVYQSWHRRVEIRRVRRRSPPNTHNYPSWRKLAVQSSQSQSPPEKTGSIKNNKR